MSDHVATPERRLDGRDLEPIKDHQGRPIHGLASGHCDGCNRNRVLTSWDRLCDACSTAAPRPTTPEPVRLSRSVILALDPAEGFCS